MAINIGRGQLTLTDLNDAIISGTEPTSKVVGTLWVDESKSPKLVKRWTGTAWLVIGEVMDEGTGETITDITETLGNMANDNIIDFNERQVIKDKLTEIIGYVQPDATTTLPTTSTLDSSNKGGFFTVRKSALNAGILSNEAVYTTVATKYNDLKTYLEGLTPIDAWDLRDTNKGTNITVVKGIFRDKWLQYYIAVDALATATAQKLKENVDSINIGGRNFASNGDFSIQLLDGLWKDAYVGQTSEIVDISSEKPPFRYAYHVKNTTATNGGIFSGTLFEGEVANELVGKEVTIQFWLKYQNIVEGANVWSDGRFGELVVRGKTSTGTSVYSYPKVYGEVVGTNMTWTKYSATIKIELPSSAVNLDLIQFKHGIESCTGEFWTTGIKLEIGNKMTDWSANPLDMQGQIRDVLFKVTPENIMLAVKSTQTYVDLEGKIDSKTKTFVATPTTPYYIGDVWKNGSTVYICTVNRTSGSYTASDWTKVGDVTSSNTAYDTARVGGTTASTVRDNASNAISAINDMSNDNKLSPVEKVQLKKEWATISAEKATYEALATTYSISTEKTNYVNAYNTLNTTLNDATNGYLINMSTTTDLGTGGGATFRAKFDDYYDKKALLVKKINETARDLANTAQTTANSKSKTFTSTPTIPYVVGDIYRNASTIYVCTTARASGSYTASDWTLVGDVTSNNTSKDTSAVNGIPASTVKGVLVNGTDVINANPIFLDWTSTNPVGYGSSALITGNTLSKVASGNGMGNAVKFTVTASGNAYLSPTQITNQPYFQYITVESTFMLESGTLDGAGVLMRYNGTSNADHKISFKSLIPSPTLNKWYTVTKTIKQATAPSGFTGYSVFPMGGWASFETVTTKVIQFDSVIARPATEQEINSYENDIMIKDMSADGKVTPMEKVQLKKEWATISAEKGTYETLANTYLITTEKNNYVTAYNTLNTALNGTGGILTNMTTTSTVTATTFRGQFDDYYDKKALLTKKINEIARQLANDAQDDIDNLEIGGTNIVNNSNFKRDLDAWINWGTATRSIITNGDKKFAKLSDAGTGTYRGISREVRPVESSTQYTISFVAYAVSGKGNVGIHQKNGGTIVTQNWWASVALTTTPKKYSFTFTTTASTVDNFLLMIGGENGSAFEVYYTDIQIEKGNRATDWSPSAQDVQWEIDNIQVGGRNLALKTATSKELTGNAGTNQTMNLYSIAGGSLSRYTGRPVTLSFDWFVEGESPSGTARIQGSNPYPTISENITFSSSNTSGRMVLTSSISDVNMTFASLNLRLDNVPATVTFTLYNLKLEIGNRATDWTPAPEDIQGQLDEKADAETITEEFNSAIVETAQDITTTLEQKIYDESGKITKAYQSELEQTARDLNLTFTEYDERIKNAEGEVLEIKTYFNFSSDGLNIGKSDSPLNINVSNDQIDFIDNGTIVAYINGQMMYIDSLQVLSSLIVGNHKIEKYNDSITLIKYSG
jgi:Carbohydrate binding domain